MPRIFGDRPSQIQFRPGEPEQIRAQKLEIVRRSVARQCAFLYRKAGAQAFAGAATDVVFGNKGYDLGSDFDGTFFTAPVEGFYRLNAQVTHDSTATAGDRWSLDLVRVNAANSIHASRSFIIPNPANYNTVSLYTEISIAQGDKVRFQLRRVGGAGTLTSWTDTVLSMITGGLLAHA